MTTNSTSTTICSVWLWQSNSDPFDVNQSAQWTAYSPDISNKIEAAYRRGVEYIYIKDQYEVDLIHKLQRHIDHSSRLRPIRREGGTDNDIDQIESRNDDHRWHRERFAFPLDPDPAHNAIGDTRYHGSPFVADWFLWFTKGKLKLIFDRIYEALVQGIRKEGEQQFEHHTKEIIDFLEKQTRSEKSKAQNTSRIEKLQQDCGKLYTKHCFLFGLINQTLRDNDRSKLASLGPYCYLVYNYIGSRVTDYLSVRHRLRQLIHATESRSMFVYRGDHVTREKIEEYRQAAGKKEKYFKWLSFVSTSRSEEVAEMFGRNILYIIELRRYASNDQFVDLENNTFNNHEAEILLRPGVRFRVGEVKFDEETGRTRVYIKIVPSYVSNLR